MVTLKEFGAFPSDGADATPAVRAALAACRKQGEKRLIFPAGRYHFWPDRATERYLFLSNNDEGLKRIAFPLFDWDGFEVDGQGSEFLFHGFLLPFVVGNSRNVTLRNFSVDWEQPFHGEGIVTAARAGQVELEISEAFPYRVAQGKLLFTGASPDGFQIGNALEFDTERRETAFKVWDNYGIGQEHTAEEIGPRRVRLSADFASLPTPGSTLTLMPDHRLCPAVVLDGSRNVTLSHVTIHHAGGMGVLGQRTENIALEEVSVVPRPGSGRMLSTTADATHFVSCGGHIQMTGCRFENQMDDATNVHGTYAKITARLSDHEVEVGFIHPQQVGIDIFEAGDAVGFVRATTLETFHRAQVAGVERFNKALTRLTFDAPLPAGVQPGDAVESERWAPNLTIRECVSRGNRARGFLVSTAGKVRIEGNHFHVPGSAILIAGDANFWYESGAVRDVTISRNHFDNCNYGVWGRATIDICPEIEDAHRGGMSYHRNITIKGNTFETFHGNLLQAQCVDGLRVSGNKIVLSAAYPTEESLAEKGLAEPFQATSCRNVEVML